jgi:hypothetical protein
MEVNGQFHALATSASEKMPLGTHWIGCWMDPRAGLEDMEHLHLLSYQKSNSATSLTQPIADSYTNYATKALSEQGFENIWAKDICSDMRMMKGA